MSDSVLLLEWKFEPADFFEVCKEEVRPEYEMKIELGKANARIKPEYYPNKSEGEIADIFHANLKNRFLGVQVQSHRRFTLSTPSLLRVYADGRKAYAYIASGVKALGGPGGDYSFTDKDGNVVYDSKKARIEAKEIFANLAEKHAPRNRLARELLESFGQALGNQKRALVYLYDILEALKKEFGGTEGLRDSLSVSANRLNRLHRLANDLPLKEGRHPGKDIKALRGATKLELQEAHDIAEKLILAFLCHLEQDPNSGEG